MDPSYMSRLYPMSRAPKQGTTLTVLIQEKKKNNQSQNYEEDKLLHQKTSISKVEKVVFCMQND